MKNRLVKVRASGIFAGAAMCAGICALAGAGVVLGQQAPPGPIRPGGQGASSAEQTGPGGQGQGQGQPGKRGARGPLAELRRMGYMVGQWEEEVKYAGEEQAGRGRWMVRPAAGRYLTIYYEGEGPTGPYRALGVLTFDQKEGAYRMWWFDDAGGVGEYRGEMSSEDTLTLEHSAKQDGRDFRERIRYTRLGPEECRTTIEQAWDGGEYATYMEATAKKTGPPPPAQGFGPGKRR